jgi:hypothetical protein
MGVSSIVTPFCKTEGLFFNKDNEPEGFKRSFEKELFNYRKANEEGYFVDITDESKEKVKEVMVNLAKYFHVKDEENKKNRKFYVRYRRNTTEES